MNARRVGSGMRHLATPERLYYQARYGWTPERWPNATRIGRQTVSLPLSPKGHVGQARQGGVRQGHERSHCWRGRTRAMVNHAGRRTLIRPFGAPSPGGRRKKSLGLLDHREKEKNRNPSPVGRGAGVRVRACAMMNHAGRRTLIRPFGAPSPGGRRKKSLGLLDHREKEKNRNPSPIGIGTLDRRGNGKNRNPSPVGRGAWVRVRTRAMVNHAGRRTLIRPFGAPSPGGRREKSLGLLDHREKEKNRNPSPAGRGAGVRVRFDASQDSLCA